ncbi:hypothetical protein ALC56_07463, partial [Trachymyrmex septentrionalis]
FEYPRGQPRAYLSCLYVLVKWGFLMFFYYSLYFIMPNEKTYVSQITELVLVNLLILISFCRFKELKMCLREFVVVDDTLEALGAPKEYQMLRKWIIRIIIHLWMDCTLFFSINISFIYILSY